MKAQFAVVEALLSVMLLSTTLALVAGSAYTTSKLQSDYKTSYGDALYDFSIMATRNQSASSCVSSIGPNCGQLLSTIISVYGVAYVRLSVGNVSAAQGSYQGCTKSGQLCFPERSAVGYTVECIYICGD